MANEKLRIVVLDGEKLNPGDNPWAPVEALGDLTVYDWTNEDEAVERTRDADIILTNKSLLTREHMKQLPKLRFISVLATGFNIVDTEFAR